MQKKITRIFSGFVLIGTHQLVVWQVVKTKTGLHSPVLAGGRIWTTGSRYCSVAVWCELQTTFSRMSYRLHFREWATDYTFANELHFREWATYYTFAVDRIFATEPQFREWATLSRIGYRLYFIGLKTQREMCYVSSLRTHQLRCTIIKPLR